MCASIPMLPIDSSEARIVETVRDNQVTIIAAETGAGKSTKVPLMLLNAGFGEEGMIGVAEPRRIAAMTVSDWVSQLNGCELGETIGYQIGGGVRVFGRDTKVKFMTEGILLNEVHSDPLLKKYKAVMLDEWHERGINGDLLAAILMNVLRVRPEFRLIVTSATMDTQRCSEYYGGAPVIDVPGRQYPVEVRYEYTREEDVPENGDLLDAIVEVIDRTARQEHGDFIVFMPDEKTIKQLCNKIDRKVPGVRALPLYGAQSPSEQKEVYVRHARRVIVATNIAETAITVPGVRICIDSGLIKETVYVSASMSALEVIEHSQAGCDQRKGRVGRDRDGICIRMYTEANFKRRLAYTVPEILRTSLDQVLLYLRILGHSLETIKSFKFMDSPDADRWDDAEVRLKLLGALDEEGKVTDDGKKMNRLPVAPMLARMILTADSFGCLSEIVTVVAGLTGRQVFYRPREEEKQAKADAAHMRLKNPLSDALTLLRVWSEWQALKPFQKKAWIDANFVNSKSLRSIERMREQILDILEYEGYALTSSNEPMVICKAVAAGLIVNLAVKRGHFDYAWQDRSVFVHPGSAMFRKEQPGILPSEVQMHRYLVCSEVVETTNQKGSTRAYMRGCSMMLAEWMSELIPVHALPREWRFEYDSFGAGERLVEACSWQGTVFSRRELDEHDFFPPAALEVIADKILDGVRYSYGGFHPKTVQLRLVWREIKTIREYPIYFESAEEQQALACLREKLLAQLEGKRTLSEVRATDLVINLEDWVSVDDLEERKARLEEERVRLKAEAAEREERERRYREENEARMAEIEERKAAVEAEVVELLGRASGLIECPDEIRHKAASVRQYNEYGWAEAELQKLLGELRVMVSRQEREVEAGMGLAKTVYDAALERFPTCPLCGSEWEKHSGRLVCFGPENEDQPDHNHRRVVSVDSGSPSAVVGRFMTDRDEQAAEVRASRHTGVQIRFAMNLGYPWTGKKFKELRFEAHAAVLPEEMVEDREEIIQWLDELRAARLKLAKFEARVAEAEQEHGRSKVKKLTFKTEYGKSVSPNGSLTYVAAYADPYPAEGETWVCTIGQPRHVGPDVEAEATPLFKAGVYSSEEEIDEIAQMIREMFPGLPEVLTT